MKQLDKNWTIITNLYLVLVFNKLNTYESLYSHLDMDVTKFEIIKNKKLVFKINSYPA